MVEVRKIGGYLKVDENGYIVKQASADRFQEKWKPIIEEVVRMHQKQFGSRLHSVYIRGSVAKGEAIDGISDLDTMAIVTARTKSDDGWAVGFSEELISKFPFVTGVEFDVIPLDKIETAKHDRIMLKTQAVCVQGTDISDQLPRLRPGQESSQHYEFIEKDIQDRLDGDESTKWIMKRVLRTGFELVMERENKYTRDLYWCYESFRKYYPEKETAMYKVLELALGASVTDEEERELLNEWSDWFGIEIEKVFSR